MPETQKPAEQTLSPKVIASTVAPLVVVVLVAVLDAVTLDLLAPLGAYAGLAYAAIGALSAGLAGYIVRDPRRH